MSVAAGKESSTYMATLTTCAVVSGYGYLFGRIPKFNGRKAMA